jgi:hypothetical protein
VTSRPGRRAKPAAPAPAFARAAIELSEYVALVGADRVAEVLGLRVSDLESLLAGRVGPTRLGMQRLRTLVRRSGGELGEP